MQKLNKSLVKVVRALVQRKKYPLYFVTAHKWFLKRVKYEAEEDIKVEVDNMFYVPGTVHLNQHGLEHLYLLLAKELGLWNVRYNWLEIPLVIKRKLKGRRVLQDLDLNKSGNIKQVGDGRIK